MARDLRRVQDPAQPRPDHLDVPYLVFTSNLDGPVDSYLDELTERLSEEAAELWGRCVGCPRPATGPPLKRYLLHNRIRTGQFVAAYPRATVAQVKEGLRLREQVITFAVRAQGLAPAELQKAFREEFTH
jgi:hypothetical protein